MFARTAGAGQTPYDIKRMCPRNPIGTGTDWAELVDAGKKIGQRWKLVTFAHDEQGFERGVRLVRQHLDAGRPVVIDFTVVVKRPDGVKKVGHTLLIVG